MAVFVRVRMSRLRSLSRPPITIVASNIDVFDKDFSIIFAT